MLIGGKRLLSELHALCIPTQRPAVENFRQHSVARRVAPQDQVALGNVFVSDARVILHARLTAKLTAPLPECMIQFSRGPRADGFMPGLARWTHHYKAAQKRIINRPLQSVTFLQSI